MLAKIAGYIFFGFIAICIVGAGYSYFQSSAPHSSWAVIESKVYYPPGKVFVPQVRKVDGMNMEVFTERMASQSYEIIARDSAGRLVYINCDWRFYKKHSPGDTIKVN